MNSFNIILMPGVFVMIQILLAYYTFKLRYPATTKHPVKAYEDTFNHPFKWRIKN